jgi:hypothetical protein
VFSFQTAAAAVAVALPALAAAAAAVAVSALAAAASAFSAVAAASAFPVLAAAASAFPAVAAAVSAASVSPDEVVAAAAAACVSPAVAVVAVAQQLRLLKPHAAGWIASGGANGAAERNRSVRLFLRKEKNYNQCCGPVCFWASWIRLLEDFLSLKNDVNVSSKRNKQKNFF